MPVLRRVVACTLIVVALVVAGTGGGASGGTLQVVVVKSALFRGPPGSGGARYGLMLRNTSSTIDAFAVTVAVKAFDSQGRMLTTDRSTITLIPAATTFAFNGHLSWNASRRVARIATVVGVGSGAPRFRVLPTVTRVKLNGSGGIDGSFTNPYPERLPPGVTFYALFLSRQGRIVGMAAAEIRVAVPPHETSPIFLDGDIETTPSQLAATSHATTVRISVDPCGDPTAGTCPVTSATPAEPVAMTADALKEYAHATGQRIYWAGPEAGMTYEYREIPSGWKYVRYLPAGVKVGSEVAYRTVATYPYQNAFRRLQRQAGVPGWARVSVGAGVIAVYERAHPTSTYVAFARVNYELEVYDPTPGAGIALVRAGRIRPIT